MHQEEEDTRRMEGERTVRKGEDGKQQQHEVNLTLSLELNCGEKGDVWEGVGKEREGDREEGEGEGDEEAEDGDTDSGIYSLYCDSLARPGSGQAGAGLHCIAARLGNI